MTTSFLTPYLAEFNAQVAEFAAKLESAAETVKQNILLEFDGLRAHTAGVRAATGKAANPKAKAPRGTSKKRTPEALALVVEEVFALIQRHPGERIERLAERAGTTTKQMALPIKKLRAAKRITVQGEKRATTYHPKGGK